MTSKKDQSLRNMKQKSNKSKSRSRDGNNKSGKGDKYKNRQNIGSRQRTASRGGNPGGVPNIPSMYAMYQQYTDRAQGDNVILVNDMTSEFDTQIANITSNWVEPAMLRATESRAVDKFSASEVADYSDYIVLATHLLLEMRAIKFQIDGAKSIIRSDTAGKPWTKPSYNSYLASITQSEPVHIPVMSMNLAGILSTPLVMAAPLPTKGYPPMYFYPMVPSSAPADIESLLQTMSTKLPGLISENNYHNLGRYATVPDLQYRAPVPFNNTELGTVMRYYLPAKDNTHHAEQNFGASYVLETDERIPVGVNYDYHRLLGQQCTTFVTSTNTPPATAVSLIYAAIGDSAYSRVYDYTTDPTNYKSYGSWSEKMNQLTGSIDFDYYMTPGQNIVVIPIGETGHDRLFTQVLVRDIVTERFPEAGFMTLGIVPLGARLAVAREQAVGKYKAQQRASNSGASAAQNTIGSSGGASLGQLRN